MTNPVDAFIEAASVQRDSHDAGTLEQAELICRQHPEVKRNVYAAALLGDEMTVRDALATDASLATAPGGPYRWDALTYLCFSRYLRFDRSRGAAFVASARALLEAGADASTGWYQTIDHPNPRLAFESAIYGAAGIARHAALTRLLLEYGADPNDEETPYHVPETDDNEVLQVLLDSGRLNDVSLATMLLRKADWHDGDGMRRLFERGANLNAVTRWGYTVLHQALRRDNDVRIIEQLLEHGADPTIRSRDGLAAAEIAAHRGRGDVLKVMQRLGMPVALTGTDRLLAACALDDRETIRALRTGEPEATRAVVAQGGTVLAEFAGTGNAAGVRHLLGCGVAADVLYEQGDAYFGIAPRSTALHVAAWRGWPGAVNVLIAAGTPVDAFDGQGRTALMLAVKACVDSYWSWRRSPDSVRALLAAGASAAGIVLPTGYDEIDTLLARSNG
jgi:ankyrin repeat protein